MKTVISQKPCYGCRVCELICTYHHRGIFSPEGGSIKVYKDLRTGKMSWRVDSTCDLCVGEDRPLCIRYCTYGVLVILKKEK